MLTSLERLSEHLATASTREMLDSRLAAALSETSTEADASVLRLYASAVRAQIERRGAWPEIAQADVTARARELGYRDAEITFAVDAVFALGEAAWRAYQMWHHTGLVSPTMGVVCATANGPETWTAARLVAEAAVTPIGAFVVLDAALRAPQEASALLAAAYLGDPVPVLARTGGATAPNTHRARG